MPLFHEKLVQERWLRTETSPESLAVTKEQHKPVKSMTKAAKLKKINLCKDIAESSKNSKRWMKYTASGYPATIFISSW